MAEIIASAAPTNIDQVPWYRRNAFGSALTVICLITMFAGNFVPLVKIVGAIGFWVLCGLLITGNIYFPEKAPDGTLKRWSLANKVLAWVLVVGSTVWTIAGMLH
jgi:hypothetical protein